MLKLSVALVAACLVTPAFAATCQMGTKADLVHELSSDKLTDIAVPNGANADEYIIDVDAQAVWLWVLKDGCVLGKPLPLDDVEGAAPKPESAPAKPKLQGSGLEISA